MRGKEIAKGGEISLGEEKVAVAKTKEEIDFCQNAGCMFSRSAFFFFRFFEFSSTFIFL